MAIFIICWYLCGLLSCGYLTYKDWEKGIDIDIMHILMSMVGAFAGPMILVLLNDGILIKGKKK